MADTIIILKESGETDCISNHDLAVLADWAGKRKYASQNKDWQRPFSLIREGADLLLRRRAHASENENKSEGEKHEELKTFVDTSVRARVNEF